MRDAIALAMYLEGLGCIAFGLTVVLMLGLNVVNFIRGRNTGVSIIATSALISLAIYLVSAAMWDIALAYYITENPKPLNQGRFLDLEFKLQIIQTTTIWLSIPLIFIVKWFWDRYLPESTGGKMGRNFPWQPRRK